MLGEVALMKRQLVGLLAAGKIAPLSVLPTLDWAAEVAQQDDLAVVSGFHSPMEREVLNFLLRGRCGIVCVLARRLYKQVPAVYAQAYAAGRVLFVSNCAPTAIMASRHACRQRNAYVASLVGELVLSGVRESSSLAALAQQHPNPRLL